MDSSSQSRATVGNTLAGIERYPKDSNGNYVIPTNINEFNFNTYYVPDPEVMKSEEQILKSGENTDAIPGSSKFWNIEYLFADMDQNVRIMVAPVPESEKSESPILLRETYADVAQEYLRRRNNRRDFRKAQTKEEQEELRKFRLREMYKNIAYTRFYMLCGFFMIGTSSYIMFRKNKRLPLVNSIVHERSKKLVVDNGVCK